MNIGILSKRTNMFTGKITQHYEQCGHTVSVYTLENLVINEDLLKNDFYILKSKGLFFLYAGFFLEANDVKVIPDPHLSYMQKHRIQSHYLLKRAGLLTPNFYLGSLETLRNQLRVTDYPLIIKPFMRSGSRGVKVINSSDDLNPSNKKILYLEKFIAGEHYNVYFIADQVCTLVKPPLANEHVEMKKIKTPNDILKVIKKWRNYLGERILFGHLDIVREEKSNNLFIVDPGSFPEFSNWKCETSPVEEIGNLILDHAVK
jgi:hypothetical protein